MHVSHGIQVIPEFLTWAPMHACIALEDRYVNFEITPRYGWKWRGALRVIIGLILVSAIMLGLSPILPTDVYWLRAIQYALGAIVVAFVWPFLFKKLGL